MSEKFDPWKYCKVDPDSLKDNPYVNPKTPPQVDDDKGGAAGEEGDSGSDGGSPDVNIIDAGGLLLLENIVCTGSDGKPFEEHSKLEVMKDVVRDKKGTFVSFTPYKAIAHFEKQKNGLFLPSYACHCNVVVALFQASVRKKQDGSFEVINPELEKVLQQYNDYGPGYGWHNNNTIVDGSNGMIIHYPEDGDFPSHGGTDEINKAKIKVEKQFPINMNRDNSSIEDVLNNAQKLNYTKDLTGLKDPKVLIDIAEYFGRTAYAWPADNSTCSAWLGCNGVNQFNVDSSDDLSGSDAARGVRERSEP